MKKLLFFTILLTISQIQAQITAPPQGINYQAVAVDANGKEIVGVDMKGQPLAEKPIRVRFSILKDAANGTLAYREEHTTNTDANGLFNLVIGQGTPDTSLFENIDWGTGFHFLKVEMDVTGGSQYKYMGTQQLWSVPYALYAKTAGNGISSASDNGDGTLTFTYVDGSTYTTSSLTGLTGPQGPAGIQGPQGIAGTNGQDGATGPQGAQGIQGPTGANGTNGSNGTDGIGITSTVDNGDGTFTLNYSDGTSFTTTDLTGPQGVAGNNGQDGPTGLQGIQGPTGANGTNGSNGTDGVGITSTVDNGDGTFTLNYSDGTSFTTTDLTGPQGIQGPQGIAGTNGQDGAIGPQGPQGIQGPAGANGNNGSDGVGITSSVDNGNGTFTLNYSDGTSFTTADLTGPQGIQGTQGVAGSNGQDGPTGPQGIQGPAGANGTNGSNGTDGVGITSTFDNGDGTFTLNYSDGTSFTTTDLTGPQGIPGSQNAWGLTGNNGTNSTTNFLGTIDSQDLVIKTDNTERIRIESNGNIGIGTTTPMAKLHVNMDYGYGIDSSVVITDEGHLGIGTTNPLYKLDIGTSNNFNWAQRIRNAGGSGYGLLIQSGSLTSNIPTFQVQNNFNSKLFTVNSTGLVGIGTDQPVSLLNLKYSSGTGGITLSDEAAVERAHLYVEGDSSTSITNLRIDVNTKTATSDAQIRIFRSTNSTGSKFVNFLRGNGTTQSSAVIGVDGMNSYFQNHGGNVGIGNSSPLDKLHLTGGGMRIDGSYGVGFNSCPPYDTTLNEGARIYWKEIPSFGPQKDYFVFEKTDANGIDPDGGFLFVNTGNDYVKSYAMMINGNGNVGIGTTTPARTLHVKSVMRLEPIPTASAPLSPSKGDMYFDSTINKLRVYDGTVWQNCW